MAQTIHFVLATLFSHCTATNSHQRGKVPGKEHQKTKYHEVRFGEEVQRYCFQSTQESKGNTQFSDLKARYTLPVFTGRKHDP